ncbi:MAG: hypothetical protein C0449_09515 [Polaromonas sp.]|nr:hypothetical protein [Polaromonas sp.]
MIGFVECIGRPLVVGGLKRVQRFGDELADLGAQRAGFVEVGVERLVAGGVFAVERQDGPGKRRK